MLRPQRRPRRVPSQRPAGRTTGQALAQRRGQLRQARLGQGPVRRARRGVSKIPQQLKPGRLQQQTLAGFNQQVQQMTPQQQLSLKDQQAKIMAEMKKRAASGQVPAYGGKATQVMPQPMQQPKPIQGATAVQATPQPMQVPAQQATATQKPKGIPKNMLRKVLAKKAQ